ncbi:PLDc N-terminal domain-containing protein [Arthrobacter sp. NPDC097144]|uniref:PLDc N-terminal domain-containing protein n=1 Tax=Arthrobacter sp. NPDC097144 TaxID=3363946 RepID=UPI0038113E74
MLLVAEGANPVLSAWNVLVLGIGLLMVVILVGALIGIARSGQLTATAKAVWVLIVLAFPVLGPVAWFFIGRRPGTP